MIMHVQKLQINEIPKNLASSYYRKDNVLFQMRLIRTFSATKIEIR